MTASLNKVFLLGNLGNDPKLYEFNSGNQKATFSLAVNTTYRSNGETKEKTDWFRVTTWNKLAGIVKQHLGKGSTVLVEGRLVTNKIGDGEQAITTIEICADTIQFIRTKKPQGKE